MSEDELEQKRDRQVAAEEAEADAQATSIEEALETGNGEDDAVCEGDTACEGDDEEEYEFLELEIDEDDIAYYLEDEDGCEVGFVLIEDGKEVEYLYAEDDEEDGREASGPSGKKDAGDEYDLGITKEGVAEATDDLNAIYKDGIAVAAELKGAFDDIKSALDFGSILKK